MNWVFEGEVYIWFLHILKLFNINLHRCNFFIYTFVLLKNQGYANEKRNNRIQHINHFMRFFDVYSFIFNEFNNNMRKVNWTGKAYLSAGSQ